MNIPKWPVATDREIELLKEVVNSPYWGGFHEMITRFEKDFASYQQCRHAVSCVNGTVAIEMILEAAGIGRGDEVIVPAISFISTATAVSRVGGTPVFVDIEPYSFNMDPERAAAAITPRTKAILVVHFGGPLANMDRLTKLAAEHGLMLFEDSAHAHGSEWNGKRAGSIGSAGSFSFQNSKVMTCGEGGIVTSNDDRIATGVRAITNQGRREGEGWFFHYTLGTNYRITALQAAVLIAQLERLPEQIRLRTRNAEILRAATAGVPGLTWQEVPQQASVHSYYLMLGRIDAAKFGITRDEFHAALTAQGIPCTPFYPHTLYENPLYRQGGCKVEPCPVSEACIHDAFWFPHRVLMGSEELTQEIASVICKLHRG
ncbi:MAG: DegT/DnrJ/EryC1/StrS family aminotransferase [Bryobacteraceae bacterium]